MVVQTGLCGTWSETPKTGFLTTWLKLYLVHVLSRIKIVYMAKSYQELKNLDMSKKAVLTQNCKQAGFKKKLCMANSIDPDQIVKRGAV